MPSPLDVLLLVATLAMALWLFAARRRDVRRMQALLSEQRAQYAAILDAASEAIVSVDDAQRIVFLNPAAEQLLGSPRERTLGRPFPEFVPPALRARQAEMMDRFRQGDAPAVGVDRRIETPVLRADGHQVEVEVSASRASLPGHGDGRMLYTLILRDITEQRTAERDLDRLTERYRLVVEQSPDAIWLAEGGRLQLVNPACVDLLGAHSADELLGRPLDEVLGPLVEDLRGAVASPPNAVTTETTETTETTAPARSAPSSPRVARLRRLDGKPIDVEVSIAGVPDHDRGALQGVMRDVSWRLQAEATLHETQAALLQSQQIARLGYATLDLADGRWTISPSLADLLGLPGESALLLDAAWRVIHPQDLQALRTHIEQEVLTGRKPYDHEFRILRANDGEERWLHAIGRIERDAAGRTARLFATLQDVTARKRASLALEQSREELRRVSAGVIWAREAERRRVARELHDELGQRLSVLKLDLAAALAQQAGGAAPEASLEHLARGVDEALAATRRIAADLRPAMLDDLGLSAALEWLADGWSRRTGITITVEGDPIDDTLTEAGAITVYRIVQEALTNVTRHAQARHAHIEVRRHGAELLVVVEDDGRGLAAGDTDKRGSSGLAGIRERARLLGGVATVGNRAGGGVRLAVRLPMERVDSSHGALGALGTPGAPESTR